MLLGSIVFFGLITAFAATRDAVISELSDVAGFSQDFNQSFSYNGATGASGETAGSDYLDQLDIADDAEDLAGQADNGILFNAAPLERVRRGCRRGRDIQWDRRNKQRSCIERWNARVI